MKALGARCKKTDNRNIRQPPQNVRIKKVVRQNRLEKSVPPCEKKVMEMPKPTKEIPSLNAVIIDEKLLREYQHKKVEIDDSKQKIQNAQNSPTDGSTLAESSIVPNIAPVSCSQTSADTNNDSMLKGGKDKFKGIEGLEAQINKRQQQKYYMDQLQEQIKEKEKRKQIGTLESMQKSSQEMTQPAEIKKVEVGKEEPQSLITGSHRRHIQFRPESHLESKGSIFNRDEKQALQEKKEAAAQQIKAALEAQIAEKQKCKEEEKKRKIEEDLRSEQKFANASHNSPKHIQKAEDVKTQQTITPAKIEVAPVIEANPPIINASTFLANTLPDPKTEHQEEKVNAEPPKNDEKWEGLKQEIDILNKERQELIKKLQSKDKIIDTLKDTTTNMTKKPVCAKRKVAVSANNKGKEERKLNEENFMQEKMKLIEKKIQEARERKQKNKSRVVMKTQTLRNPGRTGSAVEFEVENVPKGEPHRMHSLTNTGKKKQSIATHNTEDFTANRRDETEETENAKNISQSYVQNLDTDCQSCLIFPQRDGTFSLPSPPKITHQAHAEPEDELDKLMREYNESTKTKASRESLNQENNIFQQEKQKEEKRRSMINTMSPNIVPLFPGIQNDYEVGKKIVKPNGQYTSNIANIVNSTRAINSAYFHRCKDPNSIIDSKQIPLADFTSMNFKENLSRSNKFPLDFFQQYQTSFNL